MSSSSNSRRRSMSVSAAPYLSHSDTTSSISSSLWNSNKPKGNFLSRFKSPSTTPPITPSSSTSTTVSSTTLPHINGQQKVKRKPLATPSPTSTMTRKKYETVLGIKTEDVDDSSKKNNNNLSNGSRGFGKLFKKKQRSKSVDKKNNNASETLSSLFPTPNNHATNSPTTTKEFELPPLQPQTGFAPIINISLEEKQPVLLPNYKPQYHHYDVKPSKAATTTAPINARWSNATSRKSTGSYSIYSTFGSESIYGENESAENLVTTAATSVADINEVPEEKNVVLDLAHIVANNVQTRNPARLVTTPEQVSDEEEEEDDEDEDDEDEDEDDEDEDDDEKEEEEDDEEDEEDDDDEVEDIASDVFVDATGISQEDMERERIESRLSKRLSGGHFGSAGGLMMSIMATSSSSDTKKQKRASRPPPEDVVQSMMNWKRQSGQALAKFALEQQQKDKEIQINIVASEEEEAPPAVPEKDAAVKQFMNSNLLPTVSPQRPLPPNPEILLSTTEEVEGEEKEEELVLESKEEDTKIEEEEEEEEISNNTSGSNDPKECAALLWHEDETFVQRERIAEWLGQSKTLNTNTLNEYMEYFDFATMRLDSAFRKVCSKLYFRAEAQQIDRILEAFAKRYWQCNPKTIFGSADTVYAVVYSLLLLNTDLHVAQGSYTRMTRHAFVKNTMSTIRDQLAADPKRTRRTPNSMLAWEAHIEAYLKDMYVSVKNYQILQPMQNQQNETNNDFLSPTPMSTTSKRMSMMGGRRMIEIKRSLNTMIHKSSSTRESMLFLDEPSPRKSTSSTSRNQISTNHNRIHRRESFSSTHSGNSTGGGSIAPKNTINGALLSPNQSHMMNFMDTHAAALFANRPPYLKEGVVMRKHLLESANQKAKHREWRECLLVVGQGELKMYGLQSDANDTYASSSSARRNMIRASSASFANLADSLTKNYQNATNSATNINTSVSFGGVSQSSNHRWAAYSQLLGSIELNHSLANALPPPGYNRTRPYVFAIQEPNGGVYLIQAASQEQIIEWVSTCNYWAARQSKEPLQGGVSNIEYGWGSCLDDVILDLDAVESGKKITGKYFHDPDAVNISHWVPPAPTMVSSVLDESTHYDNLQKYLEQLNQEINDHREIKRKILVKFPHKSQNHSKALSNWEAKSKYMLHEIIKYQNYCDVLEKSILRREKEEEEYEEKKEEEEEQQE